MNSKTLNYVTLALLAAGTVMYGYSVVKQNKSETETND